ncbi:MAG TPA: acyl-CoA thioesterase [Planctomycetes bacterium]|nr:acyl-CoA thioesterase [Planctomycetota bacterium]
MPAIPSKTHAVEETLRVRSYELDLYDHVNNGAYLSWFEDEREHFLRAGGRDYKWYPRTMDLWFVVAHLACDYLEAAIAGDILRVTTRLTRIGTSSVVFRQCAFHAASDRPRARAKVVMCFSRDGASVPIPKDFLERFAVDPGGDVWLPSEGGERQ